MAEERDSKLSQHYRDLEPLEPPAELDRKILAAAREPRGAHAPLVVPAGRHRWYYSLAAAAVLVLAVAVTLHVDRDRPDPEVTASPEPAPQAQRAPESKAERSESFTPEPKPQVSTGKLSRADAAPPAAPAPEAPAGQQAPPAAPSAGAPSGEQQPSGTELLAKRKVEAAPAPHKPAGSPAPSSSTGTPDYSRQERAAAKARAAPAPGEARDEARQRQQGAESALMGGVAASATGVPPSPVPAAAPPEKPERWLERIAELRSRGRHAEADKELAEFRRVYPNFRLTEVMRERVEGR